MSEATDKSADEARSEQGDVIVVDIGKKQKRKRIRDLRKGRGALFEKVMGILEELEGEGTIQSGQQPVVIVVRQKSRRFKGIFR